MTQQANHRLAGVVVTALAIVASVMVGAGPASAQSADEANLTEVLRVPNSSVVMADGKPWPGLEASEASCLQLFVGKADDEVQAVLLAFDGVAFRTVAPDGTPPDDVQAAQRRLQACVDGEVEIEEFGRCRQ